MSHYNFEISGAIIINMNMYNLKVIFCFTAGFSAVTLAELTANQESFCHVTGRRGAVDLIPVSRS